MWKRISKAIAIFMFSFLMVLGVAPSADEAKAASDDQFNKISADLYPKAKKEGGLIVYTVWDVEHIVAILDAFKKRYPDIKTEYWQARNPEIITRALTEFRAGRGSVDAILSDNAPPVLRAAGAIMSYDTVQRGSLVMHDPDMPVVSMQIQALTYNTKRLKAADLPKTWEDVATPKYKGIVALDDPMRAGPLSTMLAALKSHWKDDARWTRFVQGLKALNVPVHRSTSAMFRLVIAGEYSIAMPALLHDVLHERARGTPIDLVQSSPPVVFARYAAIYSKAPHPNTAKLFTEWLVSTDGQAALDSVGRETVRKGFPSKVSVEAAYPAGTEPITVKDKGFLEDPKKWLDDNVKPLWGG